MFNLPDPGLKPNAVSEADDLAGAFSGLRLECQTAPGREAQLARLEAATTHITKEHSHMGLFDRILGGRSLPLKLAAGLAALLLLAALSQLLPFAGGTKYAPRLEAASGGYVLIFALGPHEPTREMHEAGQRVIAQWVKDSGIQPDQLSINGGQDVKDGQYTVSLALIGATLEQAQSLASALTSIGAPEAQIVEASWYQIEAARAEERGELLLYEFDHAFIFTRGTTSEQVEQTLRDYLIETRGKCELDIDVKLEWTEDSHSCNILIAPLEEKGGH
ncbi:hypothetical protein IT575_05275 [bacterium]|nr:hypothetical protein [bacterium]